MLTLMAGVIISCSHPPWPPATDAGAEAASRLQLRHDQVTSATYRVRWEARGTEPHGTFILQIAYQKPGKFRVTGTGPFDVPAFTAVVVGDEFWFVDHHNRQFAHDQVDQLHKYDVPLASFFSGVWRGIFSGGWGGTDSTKLVPIPDQRNVFAGSSPNFAYQVAWNSGKRSPKRITITQRGNTEEGTTADTRYGGYSVDFPFWKLDGLDLTGFPGGGRHRWTILNQRYNVDIPSRFFLPLTPPDSSERQ